MNEEREREREEKGEPAFLPPAGVIRMAGRAHTYIHIYVYIYIYIYIYMPDLIACRNDINHSRLTYPRPFASRYLPPFSPLLTPPGSSRETVPTERSPPTLTSKGSFLPSIRVRIYTHLRIYALPFVRTRDRIFLYMNFSI